MVAATGNFSQMNDFLLTGVIRSVGFGRLMAKYFLKLVQSEQ